MEHFPQHYDKTEHVTWKIFISIENFLVIVEKPKFLAIFTKTGLDPRGFVYADAQSHPCSEGNSDGSVWPQSGHLADCDP